jgi:hypothetical protein
MSNPHYFKHEREDGGMTLIVAMITVLLALLLAAVLYTATRSHDGTMIVSTLTPLPPLIDSVPAYDAGQ